ncbi:bidirectional sugar transporter SWEET1-like [Lycium barbarum]|uniref:bidirectional sugar transporter SWEET1-like n=1 Tax=Lycium barbarum TaxID=112863 RepID=UPI00293F6B7D|nr:bidirectional sugar transporter SWEET1-like [Lycium barbarum]
MGHVHVIRILHTTFGIFGNVFGILLFLAPMITFKRIIMKRSTEKFSGVPYLMSLFNCLFSAWYGLPFVSPNNKLLTVLASVGGALEAIYVLIFLIFSPKKEKFKISGILFLVLSIFSIVALVSVLTLHGNKRKLLCGLAFAITCIMMFGAPLTVMRLVIKSKSVEYMPFFLSLSIFNSSTTWAIYGLLGKDPFVTVPNAIGSLLACVQLILYVIYRDNKKKQDLEMEGSIETGLGIPQNELQKNMEASQLDNGL